MTSKPTVAIIGASADRSKYGNKSVRAHLAAGYEVFPVNPKAEQIEGLKVYRRVEDIPVALDRVSMYVPPQVGRTLLEEIARKGCGEVYFNPGSDDPELVEAAQQLGLKAVPRCSIVALGMSPRDFPDA